MKKIFKFATGEEIPKDAVYLNTVTQTKCLDDNAHDWEDCWYVWHYFLVEVKQ